MSPNISDYLCDTFFSCWNELKKKNYEEGKLELSIKNEEKKAVFVGELNNIPMKEYSLKIHSGTNHKI